MGTRRDLWDDALELPMLLPLGPHDARQQPPPGRAFTNDNRSRGLIAARFDAEHQDAGAAIRGLRAHAAS